MWSPLSSMNEPQTTDLKASLTTGSGTSTCVQLASSASHSAAHFFFCAWYTAAASGGTAAASIGTVATAKSASLRAESVAVSRCFAASQLQCLSHQSHTWP